MHRWEGDHWEKQPETFVDLLQELGFENSGIFGFSLCGFGVTSCTIQVCVFFFAKSWKSQTEFLTP
jgi:hypothetical protein